MWEEDIVVIMFESLSASYEYFTTTLKTMPTKVFATEYVTPRLIYDHMSKCTEKNSKVKMW